MPSETLAPYQPRRAARSVFVPLRGLKYHCLVWGDPARAGPQRPPLVLMHGWMDIAASFQFMVDALAEERCVIAADWRGFGRTEVPQIDSYWFPDYVGDLDALLMAPELGLDESSVVDLAGHSLGGNVVMSYAGVRAGKIRRLINLEGFGLPNLAADQAPQRLRQWLDELRDPMYFRSYPSAAAVAQRLCQNNPRLDAAHAAWLAPHWAGEREDGRWHVRGDPAHRRINPVPYRGDEALALWAAVTAPLLWVEGSLTHIGNRAEEPLRRAEFETRLARVAQVRKAMLEGAGHMLHFDQPSTLAGLIDAFLDDAALGA